MEQVGHTPHHFGKPVSILKFGEDNKVIADTAEWEKMILHPDVKHRKVVTFSIIGAFRRGKSFFLDYCLRYLYATVSSRTNTNCAEIYFKLPYSTLQSTTPTRVSAITKNGLEEPKNR